MKYEGEYGYFPLISNLSVIDNKFIGLIDAFKFRQFKDVVQNSTNPEFKKKYLDVYNVLSTQSNPIIVFTEYNIF